MDMRQTLVAAALTVLEERGEAKFSTRAVCALAKVTAPTLYHHFSNADGLLSAAIESAFEQYLASKQAAIRSADPVTALGDGWDNYVRFAAERPRLYSAMMARLLQGADIPAARQALALLNQQLEAIAAAGRLALPVEIAAQIAWSTVQAAALLHVNATLDSIRFHPPDPRAIATLRDSALKAICTS